MEDVALRSAQSTGWQRLLIEPKRPDRIRNRPGAFWLTVAAVCVGAFMGQLDASIVTVALPTLQHTFDASVGAVTWVGLSYLLVLVATVVAVGRLADMWGRKLLYVYGFGIFIIGSALCGLAPSLGWLIGFRALQAVGAALLQANSVAIIVLAVPKPSMGRAIGIQGAAQAVGLALGPTVGGFLLAAGGWRLIFFVNVPFGLVGMIAGVLLIPRSRNLQEPTPFDWIGFTLFFPAVLAVFTAISFGNARGWSSPLIIGLLVVGAGLVGAFIVRQRRCTHPMLDLRLFRLPRFGAGITSGLLSYLVMFGVLFLVPFYLERSVGLGSGRAGLELMVMPVALGITAPFAGRLADRIGARPLTVGGMACVSGGLMALALLRPATSLFLILLAVVGFGMGAFTPPNNATIMGAVPPRQAGVASGVLNMTRGMGTSLGLAVTGLVFDATGGSSTSAGVVGHAFSISCVVLAGIAGLAGLIAGTSEGAGTAVPVELLAE
jgi:EmrB/QacA subfamily drug resistance transporter